MSYKRAWQLIGTLKRDVRDSLVDSTRGASGCGGHPGPMRGARALALTVHSGRCSHKPVPRALMRCQGMLRGYIRQKITLAAVAW